MQNGHITPPKPTSKKRGIIFLSPKDMQEAKKSMKEKGIKAKDVKILPLVEEIHGLANPTQAVQVNSLYRFDEVISLIISLLVMLG